MNASDVSEPSATGESSAATCACASCSVRYKLWCRVTPGGTAPPGTGHTSGLVYVKNEVTTSAVARASVGSLSKAAEIVSSLSYFAGSLAGSKANLPPPRFGAGTARARCQCMHLSVCGFTGTPYHVLLLLEKRRRQVWGRIRTRVRAARVYPVRHRHTLLDQ